MLINIIGAIELAPMKHFLYAIDPVAVLDNAKDFILQTQSRVNKEKIKQNP
jgi:hypothetical protein